LSLQGEYDLVFAEDTKTALRILKKQAFDLCLLDLLLPDGSGLDLLRQIKRKEEDLDVIVVTALTGIDVALGAMKLGAYDYITKPYKADDLFELVRRVLAKRNLEKENRFLRQEVTPQKTAQLLGTSQSIRDVVREIAAAAKSEGPILIQGEIGSGVEEVAREIHSQSSVSRGPFIKFHCSSIPKGQLEKELFGEAGDENRNKFAQIGKLEFADGGILFLHQVDRLPLETQDKLLKVFNERKMLRPGSHFSMGVNIRVIASANVKLLENLEKGTFRKDFYSFLSASSIHLPPLRERKEDIPELLSHYLKMANQKAKIQVRTIQKDAIQFLTQYYWPGNLKELENSVEMMALYACRDSLTLEDIPLDILVKQIDFSRTKAEAKLSLKRVRRQFERNYIRKVLERTRGNQTRTAASLGLHRNTLIWKLKELNLADDYKRIVKQRRDRGVGFRNL
jgi:DNA-binding NtrC family response regulator